MNFFKYKFVFQDVLMCEKEKYNQNFQKYYYLKSPSMNDILCFFRFLFILKSATHLLAP